MSEELAVQKHYIGKMRHILNMSRLDLEADKLQEDIKEI